VNSVRKFPAIERFELKIHSKYLNVSDAILIYIKLDKKKSFLIFVKLAL